MRRRRAGGVGAAASVVEDFPRLPEPAPVPPAAPALELFPEVVVEDALVPEPLLPGAVMMPEEVVLLLPPLVGTVPKPPEPPLPDEVELPRVEEPATPPPTVPPPPPVLSVETASVVPEPPDPLPDVLGVEEPAPLLLPLLPAGPEPPVSATGMDLPVDPPMGAEFPDDGVDDEGVDDEGVDDDGDPPGWVGTPLDSAERTSFSIEARPPEMTGVEGDEGEEPEVTGVDPASASLIMDASELAGESPSAGFGFPGAEDIEPSEPPVTGGAPEGFLPGTEVGMKNPENPEGAESPAVESVDDLPVEKSSEVGDLPLPDSTLPEK